jgi:succinate-acetate transporter protein
MSTPTTEGYHPDTEPPAAAASIIADPAPLGLAAFAMTTFILSLANTKTWPAGALAAISLALAYGGGVQLLAGMWEFKRGNTFGATAFSSYGAFWIAFWYLNTHTAIPAADAPVVVGTFLMGWTIFTAYMTIATLRLNMALVVVFVLLTLTFVALTIGAFHSSTGWNKLGGWLGVATAAAAWYTSFAIVLKSTFNRDVLPVYPYGG